MEKSIVIPIHNNVIGDGEPGDGLTIGVVNLIRAMYAIGWAVEDFGEPSDLEVWNNDMTDLHFNWDPLAAVVIGEHFIKTGGNV